MKRVIPQAMCTRNCNRNFAYISFINPQSMGCLQSNIRCMTFICSLKSAFKCEQIQVPAHVLMWERSTFGFFAHCCCCVEVCLLCFNVFVRGKMNGQLKTRICHVLFQSKMTKESCSETRRYLVVL